jgi:hypothetical protein
MSCDLAGHLMDDYLEDDLSDHDRQRLEKHLSSCPDCAQELRDRLTFERSVRQALMTSVQHIQLAPEASKGVFRAVENSAPRPAWVDVAGEFARMIPGLAATGLLLVAVLFVLGRIPMPSRVQRVVLPLASRPTEALAPSGLIVEPPRIHPGDLFTVTLPIEGALFQDVRTIRGNLTIDGPTGQYSFVFDVPGPVPASGGVVVQVTPAVLAGPCRRQYEMSPAELLRAPGLYSFRVALFESNAALAP